MFGFLKTEIFTTFDLQEYNNVKQLLAQAGIRYYVRSVNTNSNRNPGNVWGGHMTTIGPLDGKYAIQYRILVRNKDVDAATHALHQGNRW